MQTEGSFQMKMAVPVFHLNMGGVLHQAVQTKGAKQDAVFIFIEGNTAGEQLQMIFFCNLVQLVHHLPAVAAVGAGLVFRDVPGRTGFGSQIRFQRNGSVQVIGICKGHPFSQCLHVAPLYGKHGDWLPGLHRNDLAIFVIGSRNIKAIFPHFQIL